MTEPTDYRIELAKLLAEVDNSNAITTDQMAQLQTGLDNLWQKTEGDEDAHAIISQTWNNAVQLAEQNASLTFQVIASGNIAQAALQEEKIARDELGNLQDAIEAMDEDHPALSGFAETIREWAQEDFDDWMEDEGWPEAMAEAFEEIRGEVVEKVHKLTGCGLAASNKFVAVIMGRRAQLTPRQEELFAIFMETFVEMVEASEANAEAVNGTH